MPSLKYGLLIVNITDTKNMAKLYDLDFSCLKYNCINLSMGKGSKHRPKFFHLLLIKAAYLERFNSFSGFPEVLHNEFVFIWMRKQVEFNKPRLLLYNWEHLFPEQFNSLLNSIFRNFHSRDLNIHDVALLMYTPPIAGYYSSYSKLSLTIFPEANLSENSTVSIFGSHTCCCGL